MATLSSGFKVTFRELEGSGSGDIYTCPSKRMAYVAFVSSQGSNNISAKRRVVNAGGGYTTHSQILAPHGPNAAAFSHNIFSMITSGQIGTANTVENVTVLYGGDKINASGGGDYRVIIIEVS